MLKKIKKFKIHIRPSYVLRNLKRSLNLNVLDEELEKNVQQEIEKVQHLLSPSAIYETYSKMQCPAPFSPLWKQAPNDAISISLIAASICSQIENEIEKSRTHSEWGNGSESMRAQMLDAIARESLEQSLHFALKLIGEEAKKENCELSVTLPLDPTYLEATLSFLETAKADIRPTGDGNLSPLYSSVSYCFWRPTRPVRGKPPRGG